MNGDRSDKSERARFLKCKNKIIGDDHLREGIGTYNEKILHLIIKHYIDEDETHHEQKIRGCVADVLNFQGIFEVQTGGLHPLRGKLERYLAEPGERVCIVVPVARIKRLAWINPENGETGKLRLSPKHGGIFDIMRELAYIRDYLIDPNLCIRVLLMEIEEYRLLNGWSRDKKRGSARCERVPVDLLGEVNLCGKKSYRALLPEGLPDSFTSGEFSRACGAGRGNMYGALAVLEAVGVIQRIGKRGRSILYGITYP